MTRIEAENLLMNSEGRLCVRFYRRADGSILTKDCPVGWQAIKQRVSKTATAFASLVFAALSGVGLSNYFNQTKETAPLTGEISVGSIDIKTETFSTPQSEVEMGKPRVSETAEQNYPIAGGIGNIDAVRREIKNQRKR